MPDSYAPPTLPRGQWQQLLQWNRPLPERAELCIHHLIEAQVSARPGMVAVTSSHGDLTYSDLDRIANRVASVLRRRGVGPEVIVPLCFDKSPWMVIAMMAVLKSGGAFVALDPGSPSARTSGILDQIDARVVLTAPSHEHIFASFSLDVVQLSDDELSNFPCANDWKPSQVHPSNAAYVIFTSGSTGKPKGVVVEHQSFCSGIVLHAPAQFLDEHSRVLQFASYTHDTCLVEILTTLCVGGTICSPSEDQRSDGLAEFINSSAVNWAVLTPSFVASIDPDEVPTLEVVVLAGERLSQANIDNWATSVRLLSGYGVSECSVVTTISRPADGDRSPSHIGMPAGGVCWIVDPCDADRLMPIGDVGEILIEGPTVARGYLKNPEATHRAFIDPPAWLRPIVPEGGDGTGRRLYRTGDLGRQNANGSLDFVSRIDSQVKVAGRRIELGEVEHYVSNHPDVRLCMVLCPRMGEYANRLVAVLELHNKQGEVTLGDLVENVSESRKIAAFIRRYVPEYMVPLYWFVVARLPRLPSAKLDRRKVEGWLERQSRTAKTANLDGMIPLENATARQVAQEVASLQQLQEQSSEPEIWPANTPLRRAGIDSIKAISLVKLLDRQFGVKFPVAFLLDEATTPTVIAEHVRRAQKLGQSQYIPSQIDLNAEFDRLKHYLNSKLLAAPARHPPASMISTRSRILLTGAGGYLGHEILRHILAAGLKVVALVRASSVEDGRKRLVDRAVAGGWWSPKYEEQVEVWVGDISQENLGLPPPLFARLSGYARVDDCIDAVIHNAARVHWSESAKSLWSVNVDATVRLLEVAVQSPSIRKFVYVSGGATIAGSIRQQLTSAVDGYSQTKLLSQGLVQHCAQRVTDKIELEISAVKPGFIIGAPDGGVANPSDYLWRFLVSAIELGMYDSSAEDAWVTVSTLPLVAALIVHQVISSPSSQECLTVVQDGLREKDVWSAVRDAHYNLRPVDHQTWVTQLQRALDAHREAHLLWPLQSTLEQQGYRLGRAHSGLPSDGKLSYLRDAVCQNLRSLVDIDLCKPRHD
ncbi:amino acid adenylation [Aspergillus terreus]|uniref:Amino acid adenylation n=1 Tax=Aspergillus terreus TaxID=33178 RepID=A0A5M3Z515_ASPTE|nr:hypothetical protein ATETN484_0009001500 [Aspergillus terreus]GFF17466.1 amino acid adenylation [Aspergillus terreus]